MAWKDLAMLKADDLRLMAQLMEEAARNLSAVMETDIAEREQFRHFLPDELDGSAGMLREYADALGVPVPRRETLSPSDADAAAKKGTP
jgi:hypothetical protein